MLVNGKAYWARVTGAPHANKFKETTKQWSFDLSVDKKAQKDLLDAGMRKTYLKNKDDERGTFISFVRDATRTGGSEGKPYKIVDAHNNPWPNDKLIGNGSTLNVIVTLNERTFRGETFLKPSAISIQVWDHVEYARQSEFPNKEDEAEDLNEGGEKSW